MKKTVKSVRRSVKKFFSRLFKKKVTQRQLQKMVKTQMIKLPEPKIGGIDDTLK